MVMFNSYVSLPEGMPSDSKGRIWYSRSLLGYTGRFWRLYRDFSYHGLIWFPGIFVRLMNLGSGIAVRFYEPRSWYFGFFSLCFYLRLCFRPRFLACANTKKSANIKQPERKPKPQPEPKKAAHI